MKTERQFEIRALPRVSEDKRLVALARGRPDAEGGYPISVTTHIRQSNVPHGFEGSPRGSVGQIAKTLIPLTVSTRR
jgi:hypothetical protein